MTLPRSASTMGVLAPVLTSGTALIGTALITPEDAVIVVPSTWTMPFCDEVPNWMAGVASDRMAVGALPLLAVGPAVPEGLANVTPPVIVAHARPLPLT